MVTKTALLTLLALVVMAGSAQVHADSIEFGVATRCDQKEKTFELAAVAEFNEQTTVVSSKFPGMRQLRNGKHQLGCNIGKTRRVLAHVEVWPASNGQCMGAGYVALKSVSVAGRHLFEAAPHTPFNFDCPSEPEMLVSVLVRGRADVGPEAIEVRRCTAKGWTWEGGYIDLRCTQEWLR